MYNPKSLKAEEFIDHQEILDTLAYADENKNNVELIDQILNKARERKGLSHREASVLLACDIPEKVQELYALAEQIKRISTATALSSSRRCTCLTTASTAVCTVPTTRRTSTSPGKS